MINKIISKIKSLFIKNVDVNDSELENWLMGYEVGFVEATKEYKAKKKSIPKNAVKEQPKQYKKVTANRKKK